LRDHLSGDNRDHAVDLFGPTNGRGKHRQTDGTQNPEPSHVLPFTFYLLPSLKRLPQAHVYRIALFSRSIQEHHPAEFEAGVGADRADGRLISQSKAVRAPQLAEIEIARMDEDVAGIGEHHNADGPANGYAELGVEHRHPVPAFGNPVHVDCGRPPEPVLRKAADRRGAASKESLALRQIVDDLSDQIPFVIDRGEGPRKSGRQPDPRTKRSDSAAGADLLEE